MALGTFPQKDNSTGNYHTKENSFEKSGKSIFKTNPIKDKKMERVNKPLLYHSTGYIARVVKENKDRVTMIIPDIPINTLYFKKLPKKITVTSLKQFSRL